MHVTYYETASYSLLCKNIWNNSFDILLTKIILTMTEGVRDDSVVCVYTVFSIIRMSKCTITISMSKCIITIFL